MEDIDLLKMSGLSAGSLAMILFLYRVFKSLIGKRFISNCCGKKLEVGVDIRESTTPKPVVVEIKNPMVKENE